MHPGLRCGPKANWHRKAHLHTTELLWSPEQQGHIQATSWEPSLAGTASRTEPCQGLFGRTLAGTGLGRARDRSNN